MLVVDCIVWFLCVCCGVMLMNGVSGINCKKCFVIFDGVYVCVCVFVCDCCVCV